MARAVLSKNAKKVTKQARGSQVKETAKLKSPKTVGLQLAGKPAKETQKKSTKAAETLALDAKKTISDKLLETIEKRKLEKSGKPAFGMKPMGRRGRRPKALADYQPSTEEQDDPYVYDNQNEHLEYDTGIRVSGSGNTGNAGSEDRGFSLDRSEDFDEELNFDW